MEEDPESIVWSLLAKGYNFSLLTILLLLIIILNGGLIVLLYEDFILIP